MRDWQMFELDEEGDFVCQKRRSALARQAAGRLGGLAAGDRSGLAVESGGSKGGRSGRAGGSTGGFTRVGVES